jgi:CMP-N,N'-diacetyllegionaminic acid synthase
MNRYHILGIIPARGGSKGIPRKNISLMNGKPLIEYTIRAAKKSKFISEVVISTEDPEIANLCSDLGCTVPFLRPAELATDSTRSLPVIQHALKEIEIINNVHYEIIVMLQPTTPLRTHDDIDQGILLLLETNADSVVSVVDVGGYHPFRMKRIMGKNQLINYIDQGFEDMRPRQELPPVYIRSGALYITRRHVLLDKNSFIGDDCRAYIMNPERAINIDTPLDLKFAEYLLKYQE